MSAAPRSDRPDASAPAAAPPPVSAPGSGPADRAAFKQRRLVRAKRLATTLLVAMLALMLLSAWLAPRYPWLQWVLAFAEAATVGALADWYAVVALFGRPLGLPIPHTAIIAARKDDIGRGLGDFVETHFLTPENVIARIEDQNAALLLADWLAQPANSTSLARTLTDFVPSLLNAAQDKDLGPFVERVFTPQLQQLDIAKWSAGALELLTAGGRHQVLLDRSIHALDGWLQRNEALIRAKFSAASPYTPRLVDKFLVRRLVTAAIDLIHEVAQSPNHELRAQFDASVLKLIDELKASPEYRALGKAVVADLIEHLRAERYYRVVWADLRARITTDLDRPGDASVLRQAVADALVFLGRELQGDEAVQQKLNAGWLALARRIVLRWRHQLSVLITDVVGRWDAGDMSRRVELEIGRDLQFIRINGTVVGGLVGLLLHALAVLVGG